MGRFFYVLGRALQITGLLTLPASLWEAEIKRSEAGSILFFVGGVLVFGIGLLLTKFSKKG